MDVTPELIHNVEFREAKRGYNTQEVDDFLEKLANEWTKLQTQEREARRRVEAAEARVGELERRVSEAEQRAGEQVGAEETLKRTLVLAQRTADAAIREAEEQASRTTASAQEQANRMLAEAQEASAQARIHAESEARRAQEDAQARVLEELRALERAREQMRADVDALEGHLDAQRDRLRLSVRELQRVLEDPSALRPIAPPAVSDVKIPDTPPAAPEAAAPERAAPEPEPADERPRLAERPLVPPPDPAGDESSAVSADRGSTGAAEAAPDAGEAADSGRATPAREGSGPRTQPVAAVQGRHVEDDAYLAELRKAMTDESPLGPRDDDDEGRSSVFGSGSDRPGRTRFGRRS
jgi:DivIVA domain-containing protein